MKVNGRHYRSVWVEEAKDGQKHLFIIDQTSLPHAFRTLELKTVKDVCLAISEMQVRGAGLIGVTAAYGVWIAARTAPAGRFEPFLRESLSSLRATRPTACNLFHALERQEKTLVGKPREDAIRAALAGAESLAEEDVEACRRIGAFGLDIIREIAARKQGKPVEILTHCNAGWLAFVDYGSALSPVYAAFDAGLPVHVWVDETRPRNQGARLTAWELGCHGVPFDIIADNAGGHIMQHGMVDMVITGADRVTRLGDAANKTGTYLKALAAADNGVPFYVALPSSTLDPALRNGVREIPIEERSPREVRYVSGLSAHGSEEVLICPETAPARNWAFDVTPARLITALITDRGVCEASEAGITGLFPEFARTV